MATHRLSIFGRLRSDNANVFLEPYTVKATNDVWKHLVLVFNDTATRDGAHGVFDVPQNYVGTAAIIVVWTSTATTNSVVWDADYRAVGGNDAESFDQTGNQESVTVTDAAPGAANRRLEASMSLTSANLAAGDTVEFSLFRDGANGSDNMAAAAMVHDVIFQYADA